MIRGLLFSVQIPLTYEHLFCNFIRQSVGQATKGRNVQLNHFVRLFNYEFLFSILFFFRISLFFKRFAPYGCYHPSFKVN